MKRKNYMFTNKSHSLRGITSTVLGLIDLVALVMVILFCYNNRGDATARFGTVALFALIFSSIGFVLGILSRLEKDRFYLFPNLGILFNVIVIGSIITVLVI